LVYNPLSDPQFIGNRNINGSYSYNIYDAGTITADSSISALGNPTYIDCDIGEAYKIVNDNYVSLDNAVEIGSSLPVLSSGSNTVTYENTITEVKITPRWWKI
jgi:phage-related protein